MKRYAMTAILESPLVVRKERHSQRSEGVDSLSGTLLRGALAQVYLQQHGSADPTFAELFVDEDMARYGPLDPDKQVVPLTAASCKREPGFRAEGKHGLADQLWLRIARRLCGRELSATVLDRSRRCSRCHQDLKGFSGFYRHDLNKGYFTPKKSWRREPVAHVGIDRSTHTAAESIFYHLPALEPTTKDANLHGILEAEDTVVVGLRNLLHVENEIIRIGHARTRGYGKVRLKIGETLAEDSNDHARWEDWSRQLTAFLTHSALGLTLEEDTFLFSLTLPTGAILLDSVLRYTLDLAGMESWLAPLPKPDASRPVLEHAGVSVFGGRLWCVAAVTRHERLRGWNAAHGLPRQDEWAVTRGSVYAYLFQGDTTSRKNLQNNLTRLQQNGVGARRIEGFGRVLVSDDFHRIFHNQETAP